MNENKTNTAEVVGEEQLEDIAGGTAETMSGGTCHFTWKNGNIKNVTFGNGLHERRIECGSKPVACPWCSCHGKNECYDRWHLVYHDGIHVNELFMQEGTTRSNHHLKKRANNYDTV